MNRRKALQNLGIISTGVMFWASCDFSSSTGSFFSKTEKTTLSELANAILPLENTPIETPDTREDFIEKVVEVCLSPTDKKKFKTGLAAIGKLSGDNANIEALAKHENEAIQFCFDTTRTLSIEHFTSSEYFMTKLMGFKFIPQGYTGCVTV